MNKDERKDVLEKMLKANDLMSPSKAHHAYDYADLLVKLCSDSEYKHANSIYQYAKAQEYASSTCEQYFAYIFEMLEPDAHSYKLEEIMIYYEKRLESLSEAGEEGLKYFTGFDPMPGIPFLIE